MLAEVAADREIAGAASAVLGAVGVLAAVQREVVRGHGSCWVRSGGRNWSWTAMLASGTMPFNYRLTPPLPPEMPKGIARREGPDDGTRHPAGEEPLALAQRVDQGMAGRMAMTRARTRPPSRNGGARDPERATQWRGGPGVGRGPSGESRPSGRNWRRAAATSPGPSRRRRRGGPRPSVAAGGSGGPRGRGRWGAIHSFRLTRRSLL